MDEVYELTEVEIYTYMAALISMEKRDAVVNLNQAALSASAGQGGKKAITQIKKITKELEKEERSDKRDKMIRQVTGKMTAPRLDNEAWKSLVEGGQNGSSRSKSIGDTT